MGLPIDIYYERLCHLVQVLEEIYQEQRPFSMTECCYIKNTSLPCGFTACAIGWAAQDAWFNERGFQLYSLNSLNIIRYEFPWCRVHYNWDAVRLFFDLDQDDAGYLFQRQSYTQDPVPVESVLARVKFFIMTRYKGETDGDATSH